MFEGLHASFIKLFFVCAVSVLCEMLSESRSIKASSPGKALRLVSSLCVCVTVFSIFLPIDGNAFFSLPPLPESTWENQAENESVIEHTRQNLEKELSSGVFEICGIKPDQLRIQFSIKRSENHTDVSITAIEVIMPASCGENTLQAVQAYIGRTLGCPADVRIAE